MVKFLWQNIVCRFGLTHIISDNMANFTSKEVAIFCAKCKVTYRVSMPYYPQDNSQAEINNRTILDSMCKSLGEAKGKWVEQLSEVL